RVPPMNDKTSLASNQVIEHLDNLFRGDNEVCELRGHEWRAVRKYISELERRLQLVPDEELRLLLRGAEDSDPSAKLVCLLRADETPEYLHRSNLALHKAFCDLSKAIGNPALEVGPESTF